MDKTIRSSLSSKYQRFVKRGISGITASNRVLPNFIIVGTVRSGTTSLYYNICEHPSVLEAAYDEIGFFDSNYHLGIDWYRSMFPTKKEMEKIKRDTGFAITGEDTPFYFWKKEAIERISEMIPDIKIISIFRNPIDRAFSNYNLGIRLKTEELSFEESIEEELDYIKRNGFRNTVDRKRSYISKGLYEEQIKLWFNIFPKEQIHILSTEDMHRNPEKELQKIFKFLEISEYQIKNPQKQKSVKYEKMNDRTRERLLEYYKPFNEKFFKIINKRFDWEI